MGQLKAARGVSSRIQKKVSLSVRDKIGEEKVKTKNANGKLDREQKTTGGELEKREALDLGWEEAVKSQPLRQSDY